MEKLRQARWAQLPRGRRMGLLPKQDYDARVANAGDGGCARLPIPPANCFSENARSARTAASPLWAVPECPCIGGCSLASMDFLFSIKISADARMGLYLPLASSAWTNLGFLRGQRHALKNTRGIPTGAWVNRISAVTCCCGEENTHRRVDEPPRICNAIIRVKGYPQAHG